MQPTPTWAVYRDVKTGQLVRKYIATGEGSPAESKIADPKALGKRLANS